jgi:hypothetical protein
MRTSAIVIASLAGLMFLSGMSAEAQRDYRRGYRYEPRYYSNYHSSYYRSYPRSVFFSRPYNVIPYGGYSYYYSDGYFYRPYGSTFSIIAPPLGIHVNLLPRGYRTIYVGSDPYYYYGGSFYRPYNGFYEVVNAPLGAEVPELPSDARVVVIDHQKYYELNGTYFKEAIHDNGEIWYEVTGKHGVLNTDRDDQQTETQPYSENRQASPEMGSVVNELPQDTKVVVINKQKMFVAPDGTYYSEVIEDNQVRYKVVGK